MMASVKRAALAALGVALFPVALPAVVRAVRRALVRHRDDEAVMFSTSGFGYTVIAPDLMRVAFDGRVGVVFFGPAWRYNPAAEDLFRDVTVTIGVVPDSVALGRFAVSLPVRWVFARLAIPLLAAHWRARGKTCVVFVDAPDIHPLLPEPELSDLGHARLGHALAHLRYHWVPRYFRRCAATEKPRARLPAAARAACRAAIDSVAPPGKGDVCVYVRHRASADERSVTSRNGGSAADYAPALAWLAARGYRILMTGDVEFAGALSAETRARAVLPDDVRALRNEFLLYAATECDLWVGEDGGGTNVAWVARRKMLGVNWVPFYAVFPGMALCYKTVHRPGDAAPLGADFMFGAGAFVFDYPGLELRNNSPKMLLSAVADFVERHERGAAPGLSIAVLGPTSPDVWFNLVPAHVSAPWFAAIGKADGVAGADLASSA